MARGSWPEALRGTCLGFGPWGFGGASAYRPPPPKPQECAPTRRRCVFPDGPRPRVAVTQGARSPRGHAPQGP